MLINFREEEDALLFVSVRINVTLTNIPQECVVSIRNYSTVVCTGSAQGVPEFNSEILWWAFNRETIW